MRKKIKTKWGISLSGEAKFLVKVGEKVSEGQILARVKNKKNKSFDFSDVLGSLSSKKRESINEKFFDVWVSEGEMFCTSGGVFSHKIFFPENGKFVVLDEFGVLKVEQEDENEKEILSPVESKVLKLEKDKIYLSFDVYEFKGEGLVEGKVWGRSEIKISNNIKDLNSNLKNSLLFTNNLSDIFLLKAEVVGVKGIVTNTKKEELSTDLPVLYLDDNEWKDVFKSEGQVSNFLLNSRVGRLLMVLE